LFRVKRKSGFIKNYLPDDSSRIEALLWILLELCCPSPQGFDLFCRDIHQAHHFSSNTNCGAPGGTQGAAQSAQNNGGSTNPGAGTAGTSW
jgi:hypothetical protein